MFEYLMPLLVMPTYENTLLVPDLPSRGGATDRVWQATQRAVGDVGERLQHCRRPSELSVSCLRRPWVGPETRAWRGSGRGAVRIGARADDCSRGGMPQLAASRGQWLGRNPRLVRGHRLHPFEATSRRVQRSGSVVPGSPRSRAPALLRL